MLGSDDHKHSPGKLADEHLCLSKLVLLFEAHWSGVEASLAIGAFRELQQGIN